MVAWATAGLTIAGGAVAADATIEMAAVVARDGFGGGASDLVVAADGSGRLWATTDRGPNGTTKVGDKKLRTLLDPEFVPHLVELELPAVGPKMFLTLFVRPQAGAPIDLRVSRGPIQ